MVDGDKIIVDLHIHSRFSRACSKELNIVNLVKWARVKGVELLGTGDFTHPEWLKELKGLEVRDGILWYSDSEGEFPFVLSSEISLVYTQDDKGRRIHLLYLAPSFEVVDKINEWLDSKGRRDYDGRPIFKISCRDFVAKMEEIDDRIEVIPAHIWTPWFGVFGSKGGFDSLEEAFGDKVNRIQAIETGISSDPKMNLKIKELREKNISIVSFSDLHSFWPWRMGREATIFKLNGRLSYDEILRQIRENDFIGTIETDPAYGKYHFDGHSKCEFSCSPEKTRELNGVCPKCGKDLVIGVDYRVDELALNGEDYGGDGGGIGDGVGGGVGGGGGKMFYTVLPLHEIISLNEGVGVNSKRCWKVYDKLIEEFGTEFRILLDVDRGELMRVSGDKVLVDLILKNRVGGIEVKPGYDGVYGEAVFG